MNKRLKVILIACFSMFLFVNKIIAQEHWIDLVEQLVDNDETNKSQLENFIEDLTYLKEHPIPINSATKEQLESLPFLSDELIENIFYYLYTCFRQLYSIPFFYKNQQENIYFNF